MAIQNPNDPKLFYLLFETYTFDFTTTSHYRSFSLLYTNPKNVQTDPLSTFTGSPSHAIQINHAHVCQNTSSSTNFFTYLEAMGQIAVCIWEVRLQLQGCSIGCNSFWDVSRILQTSNYLLQNLKSKGCLRSPDVFNAINIITRITIIIMQIQEQQNFTNSTRHTYTRFVLIYSPKMDCQPRLTHTNWPKEEGSTG